MLTVTAVNDPPTIGDIGDQTTLEDTAQGPIAFTVGDVETVADSLTVTASSDNQVLIPNANLHMNPRIFLYGLGLALFFGVLSRAYPAWRMARLDPVEALREGHR